MLYDCAIIGTGPAGLSAALTLRIHEKSILWLGSKALSDKVRKAERISNYPGFINVTGETLQEAFCRQIDEAGLEITERMVTSILPMGGKYALMAGADFYEAKTVIFATGAAQQKQLPGEAEYLGRGVSYCATCDGGLYRGKTVAVICGNPRFSHEVRYLASLAERVYVFPTYKTDESFAPNAQTLKKSVKAVEGGMRVERILLSDGTTLEVNGLFCLREAVALSALLPDLQTEENHIKTDRMQRTNKPGVFAAGDCTGRPYQYAKAVGEGNVAAHSAILYLDE